ncbi:hypothetical protein M2D63_016480 [Pseudomonas sp. BJa5]|uniref:hypothetical protein n=1 Tax=Pseudomonas sp. BJa5 TaxID=2936270 RepID=UPI00255997F9|nr:hypothetical protein [Pseudomonas sp. BGr12]MDL2422714.1 hypothetical protein [Pseudomonas sp. BGr12]
MSTSTLPPASSDDNRLISREPMFFVVSIKKLFIMTFFTLGLYSFYWSCRNWMFYRQATGENVDPVWRSLLSVFSFYLLLSLVDRRIRSTGRQYAWSPALLSVGVMLAAASPSVLLHISEHTYGRVPVSEVLVVLIPLGVMCFWIIGRAQQAINYCEFDPVGRGNTELSMTELVCALLGALCWVALVMIGILSMLLGIFDW